MFYKQIVTPAGAMAQWPAKTLFLRDKLTSLLIDRQVYICFRWHLLICLLPEWCSPQKRICQRPTEPSRGKPWRSNVKLVFSLDATTTEDETGPTGKPADSRHE